MKRLNLSPDEQRVLAVVEKQRGKEFVDKNWRLILEQAKVLGEL